MVPAKFVEKAAKDVPSVWVPITTYVGNQQYSSSCIQPESAVALA